ncbi:MAG TPA: Lrp/AsnC ligand binding domain-containing protein [Nitrososphaeraceae archaeon]|nr:Lrp/AsnC ligand binding domain-containing protein [Nitrososphaeraceae archaeon]
MPSAYILINCEPGCERAIIDELKALPVADLSLVYGICDIVAKVESDTMSKFQRHISSIRKIDKIKSSLTVMIVEG